MCVPEALAGGGAGANGPQAQGRGRGCGACADLADGRGCVHLSACV